MDLNFKKYLGLSADEKKLLNPSAGSKHHQTIGRLMGSGLNRKNSYFVAKTHTEKKHLHPKITSCVNQKVPVSLTTKEAEDIINAYNLNPTTEEPVKNIKQLPVSLELVSPNVYILNPNI